MLARYARAAARAAASATTSHLRPLLSVVSVKNKVPVRNYPCLGIEPDSDWEHSSRQQTSQTTPVEIAEQKTAQAERKANENEKIACTTAGVLYKVMKSNPPLPVPLKKEVDKCLEWYRQHIEEDMQALKEKLGRVQNQLEEKMAGATTSMSALRQELSELNKAKRQISEAQDFDPAQLREIDARFKLKPSMG